MATGSRRSSRSTLSSSSSSSRKPPQRSPSSSTAEPPLVEKFAADAARPVDSVASEPAMRPAPAPTATSEAVAPLAQRRPSTRRLSMMIEPTHRFSFDGTRPTREETKTSVVKTRADVKHTMDERLTTTTSRYQVRFVLKMALAAGLLIAIVIALVLLTLSWLYWSGSETTTPYPLPVCRTADCYAHAKVLSSSIASSIDPCQDFSQFVCTAWNRTHVPVATSLTEQLVIGSLLALTQMTAGSGGDVTMEDRPAQFMALCHNERPIQDSQGLQALKQFLLRDEVNFIGRSREHSITYALLLEALVVLSAKWLVPLWFRLDLIASGHNSSVLVIEPEPLVAFWYKLHAKLKTSYYLYLEQFIIVLYDHDPKSPLVTASYLNFLWNRSSAVQGNVFRALSMAASTRLPIPMGGKLSELPNFAPNFTSAAWAAAVSKALGSNIGDHYAVYVRSRQLLDAMNHLSRSTSAELLLYHAVWWFVQQIGALTSNTLFDYTRTAFGESDSALRCGVQVSITYNVLLASRHAASVQAAVRQSVEDTLNMVHSVAVTTVRASQHLGERAQDSTVPDAARVAFRRVADTAHIRADGLAEPLRRTEWTAPWDSLAIGFPAARESSAPSEGLRQLLLAPTIYEVVTHLQNIHSAAAQFYKVDPWSLTTYSPALKAVSVATAALQSPLFYGAGTAAIRYGGLGFVYATQLVRNMDVLALLDAAAAGKSLVADEKDHLLESFDCSHADEKQRAFPHLPALFLAHAAYNKVRNAVGSVRHANSPQL
ncbi:hypothetical protein HPB49_008733 [Dermacentor silvarum]|uniref:Uncharacterized protein n=1 Tax=Dermacentor silvarum TaxID=543639 RepID=A0ACB8DIV3_DERSI|nr:hypothetical protein HPB49_008733 [Dermacentor silvarum]